MSHEDVKFHALRGVEVGEDPDVTAEVVRQLVVESRRQGENAPSKNDHRVVGFFVARTQLTLMIRVFGPTAMIRAMNAKAAKRYWTAFSWAVLEEARGKG